MNTNTDMELELEMESESWGSNIIEPYVHNPLVYGTDMALPPPIFHDHSPYQATNLVVLNKPKSQPLTRSSSSTCSYKFQKWW